MFHIYAVENRNRTSMVIVAKNPVHAKEFAMAQNFARKQENLHVRMEAPADERAALLLTYDFRGVLVKETAVYASRWHIVDRHNTHLTSEWSGR